MQNRAKIDSSLGGWCSYRMHRNQNAGCKIRPKELVRRVQLTVHPHPAFCIGCSVCRYAG